MNTLKLLFLTLLFTHLYVWPHRLLPRIKNFLPENPIILIAGCYDGEDIVTMTQIWPHSDIYSFEPVPLLFLKTKAKTFNCKNVHCYQLALSDQSGRAQLYLSSDPENDISRSSSLLEPKDHLKLYPEVKFNKSIEVQTITLDDWGQLHNVNHIDLLWLDMQGAEFNIIKSAPLLLKTVKVLFTKIAFTETYKNISLYSEVRPWLESQGFIEIFQEACGSAQAEGYAIFIRKI